MTTVLVSGVSGHVGYALAGRVADGGYSVRALVRTDAQASDARQRGWEPVLADLTLPATLGPALAGAELVLHCAATGSMDRAVAYAVNVDGTRALATAAQAAGVQRFVHISTMSVYGSVQPDGTDEDSPLALDDEHPYVVTKALAELAVVEARAAGLETVVLRPGAICNSVRSQWGDELVGRLRARGWPEDLHPEDTIPWVHAANLAEMAWLALTHPAAANEAFIAVDRDVLVNDFFVPIADALAIEVKVPARPPQAGRCRHGKIAEKLGYTPLRTFGETMEQLVRMARSPSAADG